MEALGMKKGLCCVVVILAGTACSLAKADEVTDLKDQLASQEKQTAELKQRIDQLEARQKIKEKAASEKIAEVEKKAAEKKDTGLPESLKWAENINLFGDFRYRNDWLNQEGKPERDRNRIRARLGVAAKINDEWDVGMRLATAEKGNPVSGNQTLGQSDSDKAIWLNTAFLNYHPAVIKGFNVTAGKMEVPFYAVGKNQLIWDADLTLEGGAARYVWSVCKQTKVTVNGGGFWLAENAAAADPAVWGLQAYVEQALGGPSSVIGGASYYNYTHIKGYTNLKREWDPTSNDFFGNSSIGGSSGVFANDYDLVEVFAEFNTKVADLPVSAFGNWVTNTAASSGYEDTGWLVGCKLNKAVNPGSWEFGYDYRKLGTDAVVGQFSEDDFINGTGGKGHKFVFAYQVAKNVQAVASYWLDKITRPGTTSANDDYGRFFADVVVKFK
jgi:hypothetical protein